jgi:hypothetical protein
MPLSRIQLNQSSPVPASATATGTAGQIAYDGDYLYVATAANTWERASLSTWVSFVPTSVAGLQLWLDASDASTLYDATSGGSLVSADGAVARWQDKSANARHFTQATSGKRPTRKTAQQNGLGTLLFDGVNDVLDGSDFLDLNTGSMTIFAVYKKTATNTRYDFIIKTSTSGNGWLLLLNPSNVAFRSQNESGATMATTSTISTAGWTVTSLSVSAGSVGSTVIYRNGSALTMDSPTQSTGGLETPPNTNGIIRIGAQEYVGDFYFHTSADVAEILMYDSALSSTDRSLCTQYLMSKWGIS